MALWNVYSSFHWCKNYEIRPRDARVIVENKWFIFMEHRVHLLLRPTTYMLWHACLVEYGCRLSRRLYCHKMWAFYRDFNKVLGEHCWFHRKSGTRVSTRLSPCTLTYKVLSTSQPTYLFKFSLRPYSSVVTISRPCYFLISQHCKPFFSTCSTPLLE